jgi:hypothetical protein
VINERPQPAVRSLSARTKDPGLGPPIYASTLTGRHPERGACACQPVVSVLVSFTPVHGGSLATVGACPHWSGTLVNGG